MSLPLCSVCQGLNDKNYKCARCIKSTCSLACWKIHHDEQCDQHHASISDPSQDPPTSSANSTRNAQPKALHGELNVAQVKALFERYPSLRAKLHHIYTTARSNDGDPLLQNSRAIERGLSLLTTALAKEEPDMAAFMSLASSGQDQNSKS